MLGLLQNNTKDTGVTYRNDQWWGWWVFRDIAEGQYPKGIYKLAKNFEFNAR